MTEASSRLRELLTIIETLDESSPPTVRQELFAVIRKWWDEIGPEVDVQAAVCSKLGISKPAFNMFLATPELCFGLETGHKNVRAGWLRDYLDYTATSEAPEDFHIWVGLTILGAAMRRKVWHDGGHFKIYPNLYTVLVSPPGIGKKTTAIRIGLDLIKAAVPDLKIISEKITPEALARTLAKSPKEVRKPSGGMKFEIRSEGIIVAPELTVFLGREQYNEGLIIFLTRLYDGDRVSVETISRSLESLDNVWVSLLGATTPTEISKAIPASASGGGLMSRLNIVYKESSPRMFPFPPPIDLAMRDLLITRLAKIESDLRGLFSFTAAGHEWYADYYRRWKSNMETGHSYVVNLERQADHVVKIGMVLNVAEDRGLELCEDVLQRAFNILQTSQRNVADISKMIDTTDKGKNTEAVLQIIRKHGGIMNYPTLLKRCYRRIGNAKDMNIILDTLYEAKIIDKWRDETKKPVTWWYKITRWEE